MTNYEVINKALQELGVVASGEAANAADAQDALDLLNQMMAQWSVEDRDMHFAPQDTLSDVCPIPTWSETAVITNLAVNCAGPFRSPVSAPTVDRARNSLNSLTVVLMNLKLEGADMSHMPQGQGGRWNILTDQPI